LIGNNKLNFTDYNNRKIGDFTEEEFLHLNKITGFPPSKSDISYRRARQSSIGQTYTWLNIVSYLKESFNQKEVIIAGGAPRDWVLGKEIRDLDIYLSFPENFSKDFCIAAIVGTFQDTDLELSDVKLLNKDTEDGTDDYTYNRRAIDFVVRGKLSNIRRPREEPMSVEFIFLKMSPIQYVNSCFCCSLSKVYFDDDFKFSTPFIETLMTRELTFDWSSGRYNPDYIHKITKKYPEFKISDDEVQRLNRHFGRKAFF
jgi:hypothetical protein